MSMILGDSEKSSEKALCGMLINILSLDDETQETIEEKFQKLEITEGFGIHLSKIIVDPNNESAIRQTASIHLKQYIETHWCTLAEKFHPPEIKLEIKESIKELLPEGLREPDTKIRTAVADAISTIAHWDCPGNWHGLMDVLVEYLRGENEFALQGAMQVLTAFTRELTDAQLPKVVPIILQEMCAIFESENQYSVRIRSNAIEILTTIGNFIAAQEDFDKDLAEQYLQPVVAKFYEKFIESLKTPNGPTSDIQLKTEIAKALIMLIKNLPKSILSFMEEILPPIWKALIDSIKVYHQNIANETKAINDYDTDSSGETIDNHGSLICAASKFVGILLHPQFIVVAFSLSERNILQNSFTKKKLSYLILSLQVTDEQIELWTNNASQFLSEENMEVSDNNNVRNAARNLLIRIVNHWEKVAARTLTDLILKQMKKIWEKVSSGNFGATQNSWKVHEAFLLGFCIVDKIIFEKLFTTWFGKYFNENEDFDFDAFFQRFTLSCVSNSELHPLLRARYFCLIEQYVERMPPIVTARFMEAIITCLQEKIPIYTKICAVQAVTRWYEKAPIRMLLCNDYSTFILKPYLPALFREVFYLGNQLQSVDGLTIVLENFIRLELLDESFAATVSNQICTLTSTAFLKFHNDAKISKLCRHIFKKFVQRYSGFREELDEQLIPVLVDMMSVDRSPEDGTAALEVLLTLVGYLAQQKNSLLIETAFPAFCQHILSSDDQHTLQSGSSVLRIYLEAAREQVLDYTDKNGKTGRQYISELFIKLLQEQSAAASVEYTCDTMTVFITKACEENIINQLLEAVHSKILCMEDEDAVRGLLVIYAHLINANIEAVLNFLSTAPGPNGQTALEFVIFNGFCEQHEFLDRCGHKMMNLAFCEILRYGVTHHNSELRKITIRETVKGVETTLPLLAKICDLIRNEVDQEIEVYSPRSDSSSD